MAELDWDQFMFDHPTFWDDVDHEGDGGWNKFVRKQIDHSWEERKIKNRNIGEDIAMQRLATEEFLNSQKEGKLGKKFPKFYWVTINPKTEILLKEFQKFCEKVFTKKWIEASVYVLEMADKFHCHGLIMTNNKDYAYARAKKEFAQSALAVCNSWNSSIFVFEEVSLEVARDKFKYMSGKKRESKQDHVEDTKLFRLEYDIPDYYIPRGGLLTLLAPSEPVEVSVEESVEPQLESVEPPLEWDQLQ